MQKVMFVANLFCPISFLVRIPPCVSWLLFQLLSRHESLKYESLISVSDIHLNTSVQADWIETGLTE